VALAADDVTMAPRIAPAIHEVVNAGGQDPSPAPLLWAYRPAVKALMEWVAGRFGKDDFYPNA
jgi:hypothetical protein